MGQENEQIMEQLLRSTIINCLDEPLSTFPYAFPMYWRVQPADGSVEQLLITPWAIGVRANTRRVLVLTGTETEGQQQAPPTPEERTFHCSPCAGASLSFWGLLANNRIMATSYRVVGHTTDMVEAKTKFLSAEKCSL